MNDAAGIGVLTTDRQLRVRSWNPWLAAATGRDEGEVLGQPLEELTGGPTSAWYHDLFLEVIESGTARVLAPAFHRFLIPCAPQGPSPHFDRMQQRVTVAPLRHDADVVGLIVTIEDVTWRLDAERELAAELQRAPHVTAAVANIGVPNWKMRRVAVEALRRAASRQDIEHLIQTLRRDHHDINVLSSALQVLVSADIDVAPALVELLSDVDPNLRMHAALALGQLHSHEAVPALIGVLDDPDPNVRFHAIEALGSLAAADAVEALADIAESGDFFLSFAAIEALGKTDDARVAPRLCAMLANELLRRAVIDTLGSLGDEDCVVPLVTLLNGGAEVAAVAAALQRIHGRYDEAYGGGSHIADLVHTALTADGIAALSATLTDGASLRPVVIVLGWAGKAAVPALMRVLGDSNVQASLDTALLTIGVDAVEPLIEALDAGTRDARVAAAALLGRLGDTRAVDPLIATLDATDGQLAAAVAGALGTLGDAGALDGLLGLFADPRAFVRQAAISAINAISADATAGAISTRLANPDAHVRECAVRVAGYFGFADAAAAVIAAVDDEDENVRRAAIEQLQVLQHPEALSALATAMSQDTPRNRAAAAQTAGFVDDVVTAQALVRALDDTDAWVRYFAAGSLARRRIASAAPRLEERALHDEATQVRIAAMHALGTLDSPQLYPVAATLTRDADSDLAAAALTALSAVSDPRVDQLLEDAARGSDAACRIPAIVAMAGRPGLQSVEVLAWAARLENPRELRDVAIEGLRRQAQALSPRVAAAAVDALLGLSVERDTRDDALAALAMLPETAIAPVAAALGTGRLSIRLAAVEALARMRHPDASAALARGLDDAVPAVRSAAIGVFGRLGTRVVGPRLATMRSDDPDDGVRRRAAAVCDRHGWGSDR